MAQVDMNFLIIGHTSIHSMDKQLFNGSRYQMVEFFIQIVLSTPNPTLNL